jgi:hypothetical protein
MAEINEMETKQKSMKHNFLLTNKNDTTIVKLLKKCIDFFERKEMDNFLNAYGLLKLNQRT